MKSSFGFGKAALTACVIAGIGMLNGCGVNVVVSSSPSLVAPGATEDLKIKLVNPSRCPVGGVEALGIAYVSVADLQTGNQFLTDLIQGIVGAACSGQSVQVPSGITCMVVADHIECNLDHDVFPGDGAPDVVGSFPLSLGSMRLMCERSGSHISCPLPSHAGASGEVSAALSTDPLNCMSFGSYVQCLGGDIAGGDMVMTTIPVTAPLDRSGPLFNVVFAGASQLGVCKSGSRQGEPCGGDSDCTGAGVGSCGSGICVDTMTNQTTGAGCDVDGDCGSGATCVACRASQPQLLTLGVGCSAITISPSIAPTVSSRGLYAAALLLLGVGIVGMRLQRVQRKAEAR
ncbi:MAG: hypothetical protein HY270_02785 [Deltaproteobacteria bacterium]|nr:hypothetical protein [Deltaproteobacteria bacterium]